MHYTINELQHRIFQHVYNVYEIIQNFFGEEYTDLQHIPNHQMMLEQMEIAGIQKVENEEVYEVSEQHLDFLTTFNRSINAEILVWWPHVRVTNENDRSIDIQDLYAKIQVTMEGRIPYENRGFQLTRTTFSSTQYAAHYIHSHLPPMGSKPFFDNPCLGRGPINNTILDLKNNYNEIAWMLFCQELALYVTVESLRGIPYIRMENVGKTVPNERFHGYTDEDYYNLLKMLTANYALSGWPFELLLLTRLIKDFTLYYLTHGHLSIDYKGGSFIVGMSYFDYMIDISNSFIDYFNAHGNQEWISALFDLSLLANVIAIDGKFYKPKGASEQSYHNYEGAPILTFKGETKTLHIERDENAQAENTILLDHYLAMFILNKTLRTINYRFKNEYTHQHSDTHTADTATTYQTVCYI